MRLTGERPMEGHTPDSLLALHDAGYREVIARLGPGRVLDVGCGVGAETVRLGGSDRQVVGVDYDPDTAAVARGASAPTDRGSRRWTAPRSASAPVPSTPCAPRTSSSTS